MLRTQGIFEGIPVGDKKLHSEVEAAAGGVSAELLGASALGLQKPFGEQEVGFSAGMVAQLKAETDGTLAVTISDGQQPAGLFADSFVDTLKSGKATYYSFFGDYFTDQFDKDATYALNAELYVVAADVGLAKKGQLTPTASRAKLDGGGKLIGKKVGHVTQIPDLANGVLLGARWQVEGKEPVLGSPTTP